MIQSVNYGKAELSLRKKKKHLLSSFSRTCEELMEAPFRFKSCPSVRPHVSALLPLGLYRSQSRKYNEVEIGQQCRALFVKTSVRLIVSGENNCHKTLFSKECYQAVRVAEKVTNITRTRHNVTLNLDSISCYISVFSYLPPPFLIKTLLAFLISHPQFDHLTTFG